MHQTHQPKSRKKCKSHYFYGISYYKQQGGPHTGKMLLVCDRFQVAQLGVGIQNNSGSARPTPSHEHKRDSHTIPWPWEVRRTLRVQLAPDGNNDAEVQYLSQVMAEWWMKMATAQISRETAEFSIRQVLYPKLRYPLIATMFSEVQCKQIVKPVLNQGLPALGINWHLPQVVAHGPWKFQGLYLPNLYTEQVVTHIHTLLRFGAQSNDPTGQLLWANGEAL